MNHLIKILKKLDIILQIKNVIKRIEEEAKNNPEMKLYLEEKFLPKDFSKFEIFKKYLKNKRRNPKNIFKSIFLNI